MHYNFDQIVHRADTNCVKYDLRKAVFDNPNVLPMWVADMDFETWLCWRLPWKGMKSLSNRRCIRRFTMQ